MKLNKLKYLLPALLFVLPACTEDEDLMQNIQGSHASSMEFTAVNGNPQSLSKTTLASGWDLLCNGNPSDVLFTNSDMIGVFSTGETAAYLSVKGLGDNGRKALFAGEVEKAAEYFALYPYQSGAKIAGNKISATIPTTQAVVHDNMDGNAALSVAYTTAESKIFAFQNVTAMIAFRTTKIYTKITVEALDGTKIAGDIAVEVSKDGGKPVVTGGTESKITLEGDAMYQGRAYCLMLKPGSIKKGQLKFTFTDSDGNEIVQTNEKDVTLEAGVCYNYGYIGTVKLTVYDGEEVAFVKYIDPSWDSGIILPEIPCDEDGFVYVYDTGRWLYAGGNWFSFDEDTSLYLRKVEACKVIIYDPEGAKVIYTKDFPCYVWYYMPTETSADGKYYAYSSTKGGEIEYHRSDGIMFESEEKVFYAVSENVFTVTIYGNGANAEPTFKQEVDYRDGLYLPNLPESDDVIYKYATSENGEGMYKSGEWVNVYEDLTFYVVSYPKVTIRVFDNDGKLYAIHQIAKGEHLGLPWFTTPEGYDYVKFATEPNGKGVYENGTWYNFEESTDLYVVYEKKDDTGKIDLREEGFSTWSDWVNGENLGAAGCAYVVGEATGLPYGDGSIVNYIDLTAYKTLEVTVSDGEPRFLLNRDVDEGQAPDHLIAIPNDVYQTAEYEAVVVNGDGTKTYTIDLTKIVEDWGFAHLHAIKGANWGNVTVISMKLTK